MDPPRLSVFSLCSFLIWFLNLNTLSFSIGLCHCMMCCVLHSLALETWLGWPSNEDMEHWKNDRYTYRKDRLLWAVLALMKGTDYTTQKLSTFISGQYFLHKLSAFILGPGEEGFVLSPEPHLGKALLSPWVWCTGILDIVSKIHLKSGLHLLLMHTVRVSDPHNDTLIKWVDFLFSWLQLSFCILDSPRHT